MNVISPIPAVSTSLGLCTQSSFGLPSGDQIQESLFNVLRCFEYPMAFGCAAATIAADQETDFTSLISCIFINSFVACALGNATMAGQKVTYGI